VSVGTPIGEFMIAHTGRMSLSTAYEHRHHLSIVCSIVILVSQVFCACRQHLTACSTSRPVTRWHTCTVQFVDYTLLYNGIEHFFRYNHYSINVCWFVGLIIVLYTLSTVTFETRLSFVKWRLFTYLHTDTVSVIAVIIITKPVVSMCRAVTVRLVGGSSDRAGRLEVYHNDLWGTVCDDSFNDVAATVACNSLGFG